MAVTHPMGLVKWEVGYMSPELRGEFTAIHLNSKILENKSNSP